jgi:hypothetical protein
MKILIGDNWNVDFDGPIPMTESQQELFVKFMETIFNPIKKVETNTFRTERIGDKIFLRGWDDDEIVMLFNTNMTLEQLCESLGRTWMSVDIKRGTLIPDLMRWAESKGNDLINGDIRKIVEEYLNDKKEILKEKRGKKSRYRKEIKKLEESIDKLDVRLNSIELRKRAGVSDQGDEERIRKTKDEIENLEKILFEDYDVVYDYEDEVVVEIDE